METSRLRVCMCLSVALVLAAAQPGLRIIKRPFVAAPPVEEDEMTLIEAECLRRIATNSSIAHYAGVPSDCSAFAACDSVKSPSLLLCPAGQFFNDDMDVLTCTLPFDSSCQGSAGDPCVGRDDGFIQDAVRTQPTQGAYFTCSNQRAIGGGWCEDGEQYLAPPQACFSIPDLPSRPPTFLEPVDCFLEAVEGDSSMFLSDGEPIDCPDNTQFNQTGCGCE